MTDQSPASSVFETLQLTPEALCSRVWRLETASGEALAQHLVFHRNGDIAGWFSEGERTWRLEGRRLVLLDRYDRRSAVFDALVVTSDGRSEFRSLDAAEGEGRVLREQGPASGPRRDAPEMHVIARIPAQPRRNLVVLRANERSLHREWARNIDDADRSWDLCISHYGARETFGQDEWAEFQVLQEAPNKYFALYDLFYEGSPFWGYERIAFPDDDIRMSWRDVNEMFAICRRYDLDLAQPAMTGFQTHAMTRPQPKYFLRYTSFVEALAPWFSRDALRRCVSSFVKTRSGWGLDHVWPKLLGEPRNRIGIVDAVVFEHTRPVGNNYDAQAAMGEAWAFQMAHDAYPRQLVYGGIQRVPTDHYLRW